MSLPHQDRRQRLPSAIGARPWRSPAQPGPGDVLRGVRARSHRRPAVQWGQGGGTNKRCRGPRPSLGRGARRLRLGSGNRATPGLGFGRNAEPLLGGPRSLQGSGRGRGRGPIRRALPSRARAPHRRGPLRGAWSRAAPLSHCLPPRGSPAVYDCGRMPELCYRSEDPVARISLSGTRCQMCFSPCISARYSKPRDVGSGLHRAITTGAGAIPKSKDIR